MSDNLFEPQEGQQSTQTADPTKEQQTPQGQESTQPQTTDPNTLFADQLTGIVGADGRQKYADVSTALNSIPHAQTHIQTLESQVATLQEELNKREGMEQLMDRIKPQTQETEQPSGNNVDAAQLGELFNQFSNQREQAQTAASNEIAFSNTMREKFGDKAGEVLAQKATELGLSTEFMQSVAQTSPKAALKYFDEVVAAGAQPTTPSNNINALTPAPAPDKLASAQAQLFGTKNPGVDKWREAGSNINN